MVRCLKPLPFKGGVGVGFGEANRLQRPMSACYLASFSEDEGFPVG